MLQHSNRIEGVKGYGGKNVRLAPGVEGTYVHLGGASVRSAAAAFVDNSGNTTNTLIDDVAGVYTYGAVTGQVHRQYAAGVLQSRAVTENTSASGAIAPRFDLGRNVLLLTAVGTLAIGNPSTASKAVLMPGDAFDLVVTQDGTGGRSVSFGTDYTGAAPAGTAANAATGYRFIWNGSKFIAT